MWFDSWAEILRVLIIGSVSYAALVVVLRVSGKRTLGQPGNFSMPSCGATASASPRCCRRCVPPDPATFPTWRRWCLKPMGASA